MSPQIQSIVREVDGIKVKLCLQCKEFKPLNHFNSVIKASVKKRPRCKNCEYKNHWDYIKTIRRPLHLKNSYGITTEQYTELYNKQEGKCKICNRWREVLSIDHCHKTNKIRGLICKECNMALGLFKDNLEVLKSAIQYLESVVS